MPFRDIEQVDHMAIESELSMPPVVAEGVAERSGMETGIGLVSPRWPVDSCANGIATYASTIVRGVQLLGREAWIVSANVGEGCADGFVQRCAARKELFDGIMWRVAPHYWSRRSAGLSIGSAVDVLRRRGAVEIVEMEETFGYARYAAVASGVPVVVRLHGPAFLTQGTDGRLLTGALRRRDRAERRGVVAAVGVTAPSHAVVAAVREHWKLPLEHARVIPNPIEGLPASKWWCRDGAEEAHVVFIGRFDRLKGADLVLEAFARLVKEVSGARLTFVGPDVGYRDEEGRRWSFSELLRKVIPDARQREQVIYEGRQPPERIEELRRKAAVVVAASRYEVFPYVLLEAFRQGCPVVATRVGGIPEIVQDERNGLLAEPGNAEDLAEKIVRLLKDRELAGRLGRQAREDCEERFNLEKIARQTLDYYAEVLERVGKKRKSG